MNKPATVTADDLSRVVKMALDTGEVASLEDGYALFARYRLGVSVDARLASSIAGQAGLLTIVNCGRRALLGGIQVTGEMDVPLLLALPEGWMTLGQAVEGLGGIRSSELPQDCPALVLGDLPGEAPEIALRVTFGAWRAGVIPIDETSGLDDQPADVLAAIVAGAIGVSEIFQNLRGNPVAGRRRSGLSLWRPDERNWEQAEAGPGNYVVPSRLWLLGLGHLGQAYLWILGLLPYAKPADLELTLQDFDRLTLANDSTSILTDRTRLGERKTRATADWAERRGFSARMIERRFAGDVALQPDDPRVLICGVDNPAARALLEEPGFDLVIEAGLGAGPVEYLAMRMHAFPSSRTARELWAHEGAPAATATVDAPAYQQLGEDGADECGLVTIASRTVGAPFVGTVAAGLVISEIIRRLNGGPSYEVIDLTLRDPSSRAAVRTSAVPESFNPGFTELAR